MTQNNQYQGLLNDTDFPRSWYPVSRSCDLKKGRHKLVKLFGQNWLLFRSFNGDAAIISRRCGHMGADLAEGKVVGNSIECPLHGWRFDTTGHCVHIPDCPEKRPLLNLQHLTCEEHYGVIFAYRGKQPPFPIPQPPEMLGKLAYSPTRLTKLSTNYLSMSLNTFDTQHFERIHNRRFVNTPEIVPVNQFALRINFEIEILKNRWIDYVMAWLVTDTSHISIECWGGNLILFSNLELESAGLIALQPTDREHCQAYLIALKKSDGKQSTLDKIQMNIAVHLIRGFLSPDIRATRMMTPFRGTLIHSLDYGAEKFWDHWQQLPRHSIEPIID